MAEELMRIARDNQARKITHIKLKIGKMSGIVTDSLIFAFDAIKSDYPLLSSALISIEEVPLVFKCSQCGENFEEDNLSFSSCPECKSYSLKLVSGEEQHIENVEVEV